MNKWVLMAVGLLMVASSIRTVSLLYDRDIHCQAAKETVIEETDLIAASGGMPSEKMTNRWRDLLKGCAE